MYSNGPEPGRSQNGDVEAEGDVRKAGRLPHGQSTSEDAGKLSTSSEAFMTPQMRSMRLIGNNVGANQLVSVAALSSVGC